jgi:hypothetical protein
MNISEEITERLAGEYYYSNRGQVRVPYLQMLWQDLSSEYLSEEEMLELGVTPNLVPAKENQPSLF